MRYFPGLIFLGSGDHAERLCKLLHMRLDEALRISGGLQQSSQRLPEDETEVARLQTECEDAVRDLAAAVLGRHVTFGPDLPYPYNDEPTRLFTKKVETP